MGTQVFVTRGGDHPDSGFRCLGRTKAAANAEPIGNNVLKRFEHSHRIPPTKTC